MKIYAVGIGPGDAGYMAPQAGEAIAQSQVIAGYTEYIRLIEPFAAGKEIIETGMRGEAERCRLAIEAARIGKTVSVVSGGDAGVYGMASLLCQLAEDMPEIEIQVVPGITAALASAAVLGAPLSNDFAVISLSDLLTPWEVIEKRLRACASADMAICLYNPRSKRRSGHLKRACGILMEHLSKETECGYVRNAFRGADCEMGLCRLQELPRADIDMFTTVIVGNSHTRVINGKLVTDRGYKL